MLSSNARIQENHCGLEAILWRTQAAASERSIRAGDVGERLLPAAGRAASRRIRRAEKASWTESQGYSRGRSRCAPGIGHDGRDAAEGPCISVAGDCAHYPEPVRRQPGPDPETALRSGQES